MDMVAESAVVVGVDEDNRISSVEQFDKLLRNTVVEDKVTRKEIRTWLIETVGKADVTKHEKCTLFTRLLHLGEDKDEFDSDDGYSERHGGLLRQIMLLICEYWPNRVVKLLNKEGEIIRLFFKENPTQVPLWFKHFAGPGGREHKYGARALSQFFFAFRDEFWQEIVWSGKHPQSPVSVAAKSHYFCEMNVEKTVQRLIDRVDMFWDSEELWDSLQNGDVVALNPSFFAEEIEERMKGRSSRREENEAWALLEDFLQFCDFPTLCSRVLLVVSDAHFLVFLNKLGGYLGGRRGERGREKADRLSSTDGRKLCPLEPTEALLQGVTWKSMDDVLLCCSCMLYGHRILNILSSEEEGGAEADGLRKLPSLLGQELHHSVRFEALRVPCEAGFRKQSQEMAKDELMVQLAVESWLLVSHLSSSLVENEVQCRNLFNGLGLEAVPVMGAGEEDKKRRRKAKKRRERKERKKRKRARKGQKDSSESSEESSSEDDEVEKVGKIIGWEICINGLSRKWEIVELREEFSFFLVCQSLRALGGNRF